MIQLVVDILELGGVLDALRLDLENRQLVEELPGRGLDQEVHDSLESV
jgi:hypothetical protein